MAPRKAAATKAPTRKPAEKKEEEKMIAFVSIPPYQASRRIYKGYRTRMGEERRWDDLTYKDGSKLEKAPRLSNVPGRFIIHSSHEDIVRYMREHPKCEGSPNKLGQAEFREVDQERDRTEALQAEEKLIRAKGMVINMEDEELYDLGAALKRASSSVTDIKNFALRMIEEDIEQFMEMFDSNGKLLDFYRAQALYYKAINPKYRVLVAGKDGTYYGDIRIGVTPQKTIEALLDDEFAEIRKSIEDDVKTKMTS